MRIISRDPSNLAWEVGIDAGTDDGLEAGMPVVGNADGAGALAGTVVSVTNDTARVRLIVDTRSVVIAVDQASRALGEVRGQPGGQLVMVNVPVTETLAVGGTIVSAGLSSARRRAAIPGGLLIGHIQAVEPDRNALTQTAFVRPAFDPSRSSGCWWCSTSARAERRCAGPHVAPSVPARARTIAAWPRPDTRPTVVGAETTHPRSPYCATAAVALSLAMQPRRHAPRDRPAPRPGGRGRTRRSSSSSGPPAPVTDSYRSHRQTRSPAWRPPPGATVVKVYSPRATWPRCGTRWPAPTWSSTWATATASPNPYGTTELPDRTNGWGLNTATTNGDKDNWSTARWSIAARRPSSAR